MRAAIERLLGKPLASSLGRDVQARGLVQKSEGGNWELQVSLAVGEHTEQDRLVAKKCQALADAMALKVALAIDPLAVADAVQRPEPAHADAPPPEIPSQPARAAVAPNERLALRLVGGVGLGPLPGATPGAGVYGSLQLSSFRVELGGEAFWGGVARYSALENVGADLGVFMAAARGCATPGNERWTLPLCGGFELGIMHGKGFGVDATNDTSSVWGGVVLGPAVRFKIARRLALWGEADVQFTLLKPEFHMRNLGTLYEPATAGARASLGFEVNL